MVFAYYLHSEHYEALFSKEKEQSLVKMRSCKVRKKAKNCVMIRRQIGKNLPEADHRFMYRLSCMRVGRRYFYAPLAQMGEHSTF